jgi:thiol-disulfide isomerase/thioredoxin
MSGPIHHITDLKEYHHLISDFPCIVKFTANWCGPCKRMEPLYNKLSEIHCSKVKFLEVDIDKSPKITNFENIQSIPLILFYDRGCKLDMEVRGFNEIMLMESVSSFVNNSSMVELQPKSSTQNDLTKDESVKDDLTKDDSTKDDSTKDESTKDDSTKDESTKDDSTKDKSNNDESTNENNVDESSKGEFSNENKEDECDFLIEKTIPEDMINNGDI